MALSKLQKIISQNIWKQFLKHFAPRRFNYTYATTVLGFRQRRSKSNKRANRIAVKRGFTRDKFLNPTITKDGIKIKLPNYTRAKEWKIPRKFSYVYTPILNETNYGKILKHISKAIPQLRANEIRKIASWFLKEKKAGAKTFRTSRSLYQELQVVKDTEIQQCSSKLKNLKIKGDQI